MSTFKYYTNRELGVPGMRSAFGFIVAWLLGVPLTLLVVLWILGVGH